MEELPQHVLNNIEISFHIPANHISKKPFVIRTPLNDFAKHLAELHRPYLLRAEFIHQAIGFSLLHLTSQGKDEDYVEEARKQGVQLCVKTESLRFVKHMEIVLSSFSDSVEVSVNKVQIHECEDDDSDDQEDGA